VFVLMHAPSSYGCYGCYGCYEDGQGDEDEKSNKFGCWRWQCAIVWWGLMDVEMLILKTVNKSRIASQEPGPHVSWFLHQSLSVPDCTFFDDNLLCKDGFPLAGRVSMSPQPTLNLLHRRAVVQWQAGMMG
jgi:hypothetical protein